MRLSMDRVVNIMTAAMALTVTVAGVAITWKTLSGPATPPRPVPYKVGEILDLPVPTVAAADDTLLLYIQSRCKFCSESMPFYQVLFKARSQRVSIVALSPEDRQVTVDYLKAHNLTADEVAQVPISGGRFLGTPTIIAVDRAKKVKGIWLGKLTPPQEREVLALAAPRTAARSRLVPTLSLGSPSIIAGGFR
jgi:hypothetical protein